MVSMKQLATRGLPLVAALALSACTIVPYDQVQTTSPASEQVKPDSEPQEALVVPQRPEGQIQSSKLEPTPASLPAAQRMRQLATAQGEKGEYRAAVALLERALRISPRDPETYYELARNHLLLENPSQALQLAQRGLSLNPSPDQRTRLEDLVEQCRQQLTA